jgi:lipopolysaccharide/colanic/teichoic acid biosynthesis glycosyltransferase
MLRLERRRTERSGRRFILMLLEWDPQLNNTNKNTDFTAFASALSHSTRETDIKGWYKEGSVFGVIFTELGDGDASAITKVLLGKVTHALCTEPGIGSLSEIRLSFHVYPEDITYGDGGFVDLTLYPDPLPDMTSKRTFRLIKRVTDILGSLFALVVLSPLLLAIALAIKLTSPGPVLFRQQRVGRFGEPFTFLKFRSMFLSNDDTIHREYVTRFIKADRNGSSGGGERVFKIEDDPRVTAIGRILRRTSLDELPQFLNVLRGEMSLVGPRPAIPYEVNCYDVWHKLRLLVKPGITGLWQVHGRSRVPFDGMVRLDLNYVTSWSLWLDIKLLLQTPWAVFMGDGAC